MSRSSTQPPPMSISRFHSSSKTWCGERPDRKPYEQSRKSCSYIASSTIATALWSTLSSRVGIPIGRVFFPSPLGMFTLLTGGALYVPFLNRFSRFSRFSSRAFSYSLDVTPSTPAAPSFRVRLYASCIHIMSM
jgi:hypothetical protein